MANARPVMATAVGGVIDLLGATVSGNDEPGGYSICERGVLVRSGDAEGFALGLKMLIENRELRDQLGRRGLEFVSQNYAKERLLRDMATLYDELGAATKPGGGSV
jgi:glycosyltransferase involved in cell wall biosynthesis